MHPKPHSLTRPLLLVGPIFCLAISVASSMPILQDRYNEHPQARPENIDDCVICHVNADGSGPLSPFGKRYDRVGLEFTPALIAEYPNYFLVNGAPAEANSDTEAAAGGSLAALVPGNEPFDVKAYYLGECKECHGKYGDGDPFQGVPAFATQKWIAERSEDTDELLNIILNGKDKMKGQAGKISASEAEELLELIRQIAQKYA